MDAWIWVVVVAVVVVVALLAIGAAWQQMRARNSRALADHFGPEYDRAVDEYGSKRKAEEALERRQERASKLALRDVAPQERARLLDAWKGAQATFVDDPTSAVEEAQGLVDEAMQARGFPLVDFDQRAEDISVEHPQVVGHYRSARSIAEANDRGEAQTEDLRQAMVHYRELFTELLSTAAYERPAREERPREERARRVPPLRPAKRH